MTDVREQLMRVLVMWPGCSRSGEIADNILMHFEVTPKPAISDEELGRMLAETFQVIGPSDRRGDVFRAKLGAFGLKIVRVDE